MFIHAEENATNNIVDAAELLRLIDVYASELLNKYNILQIVVCTSRNKTEMFNLSFWCSFSIDDRVVYFKYDSNPINYLPLALTLS